MANGNDEAGAPTTGAPTTEQAQAPPAARFKFEIGEDVCVLGAKASGKTVFLHWIYANAPRAVAFNCGGEFGFHVLSDAYVIDDLNAFKKALTAKKADGSWQYPKIEFVASDDLIGDEVRLRGIYDSVCGLVYGVQNCMLLNDELALITGGETVTHWMRLLAFRGRHHNVSHVFAGQRNQQIPKLLVAQAAHKIVYAISEYDAAAYSKWLGFDLGVVMKDAPYKSYKYVWMTEMQWRLMQPVPLLIDEKTGNMRVTPKQPVEIK